MTDLEDEAPKCRRALLVWPYFDTGFWASRLPPLALVTVAALLPAEWSMRLVDCNLRELEEDDWDAADLVLISGMIVQREALLALVREARARGKTVVVGGPYATSLPDEVKAAGADFLVLDEGELTIPPFLEALERGETSGTYRSKEKPDLATVPLPRFDLLDFRSYYSMSVQFSRGCPFLCEFCDIITLYGRRPRSKPNERMVAELDALYELGWRGAIFFVDDNFIGNKKAVLAFLKVLEPWQRERGFPFRFFTEASVDLAQNPELMERMVACGFRNAFIGIETPDEASLKITRKTQNMREPLLDAITKIQAAGIRIVGGFVLGFDGEKAGAGDRIVEFVEQTGILVAHFALLQVLPHTGLHKRLEAEGRLGSGWGDINQTTLLNFVPTRPLEEIVSEYIRAYETLYRPAAFIRRAERMYTRLGDWPRELREPLRPQLKRLAWMVWRLGVTGDARLPFWLALARLSRQGPWRLVAFITGCAQIMHFGPYSREIRSKIAAALADRQSIDTPAPPRLPTGDAAFETAAE